jgi:single-stranded-DNA-specific exonuclease
VISVEDGVGKGSGRSLKCFNMFKALSMCENLMDRFGGHEMAAGLTIQADKISALRALLNEYADSILTDAELIPCIRVDAFLDRSDATLDNAYELTQLAPFGAGNPSPVFGYTSLSIADIRTLSNRKHIKLKLMDASLVIEAIGFNMGEMLDVYETGDSLDMIFSLEVNSWNGADRLQLNIKDIKTCIYAHIDKNIVFDKANDYNRYNICTQELNSLQSQYSLNVAELIPERRDLEAMYRHLKNCERLQLSNSRRQLEFPDLFALSAVISEKYSVNMNYFKLKRCLEIFDELGLLVMEYNGSKSVKLQLSVGVEKVELEASRLYTKLQGLGVVEI